MASSNSLARLEALVPHLPLSALLAHLRRLDAAGIGFETAMAVAARMSDPAEVRASGLGPLRFAAAWGAVDSRRWEPALAAGARHSLGAVPRLPGRTLVLVEPRSDTRIVFGIALAQRCEVADRVVLVTEQFREEPDVSGKVPLYVWETRRYDRYGYEPEFTAGPRRGLFRGLGDASFRIIPWWEEFVAGDQIQS